MPGTQLSGTLNYRLSSEPEKWGPDWPMGIHPQIPDTWVQHHTKLQCPASWRLQQPRAAVGFAVSSSPVLSAQITQDSGWPFLPPKIPRQKAPGDGASSAAVVCGLQCLRYLPPAASPLTGSFPRVCHHRKFPVGKHSVSKQRVPWYKRRVNMHAAVRKTLNAEAAVARAPGHSPNSLGRTKLPQRLRNSQVRLWSSLAEV